MLSLQREQKKNREIKNTPPFHHPNMPYVPSYKIVFVCVRGRERKKRNVRGTDRGRWGSQIQWCIQEEKDGINKRQVYVIKNKYKR